MRELYVLSGWINRAEHGECNILALAARALAYPLLGRCKPGFDATVVWNIGRTG